MDPILCCRLALSILLLVSSTILAAEAGIVGVNYGTLGDNLPSPTAVVSLLKSKNVDKVRLFNPDKDALDALRGSGISVVLNVPNDDLQKLGDSAAAAKNWIDTNIIPYSNDVKFRYLAVGNEVIPGSLAVHVPPAMENLNAALKAAGIALPVSVSVHSAVLENSFPPSEGRFSDQAGDVMRSIVRFLVANRSPLLVNIYPYFSYIANPSEIQLGYALFTANRVFVTDGSNQYSNLFDAFTDAMYAALEKVGGADVKIVITESGWPSAQNGDIATVQNARTYVNNLVSHVAGISGTPRRPGKSIETYIFALFNENQKGGDPTERHFGLYYPDMTEVYPVIFSDSDSEESCCNLNMYDFII